MGRVTQCGLSCEVGKAAINPVPRQMIFEQVAGVCRESGFKGVLSIEIRVPGAFKVADKTFNSRLGIQGGISILGTSGMVEPMSETALLDTIRLELRQRIRKGEKNLLVTPGNYGENFVGNVLGLGPVSYTHLRPILPSSGRLRTRTGATVRNGTSMRKRSTRCSYALPPPTHHGLWWRAMTNDMPG